MAPLRIAHLELDREVSQRASRLTTGSSKGKNSIINHESILITGSHVLDFCHTSSASADGTQFSSYCRTACLSINPQPLDVFTRSFTCQI
ncbi:hypothetical protein CEXT_329401 [Caerostris extrusa]|uniref:Uncharacterized protein n=1 Tax=Caerostris extrusa TaxID=172846 RepID=A0AAV4R8P7_CAEEX|nr:hypothetical protein CEXT_329401 [Caerostris extrusa]